MIENLILFLEHTVIPLGVGGVFLASVLEEVIAPIPSTLVMMTAGFIFVSGPWSFNNILLVLYYVALPAGLGVALGSLWIYLLAYWGGKRFLEKFGRWIGLDWNDVINMQNKLNQGKKDEILIISARVFPVIPSVAISAFCGFIRMRFWKYFVLTFVGMSLRGLVMGILGWQLGNVYHKYANLISRFENIIFILIFIAVTVFAIIMIRKSRNKGTNV